MVSTPCHITVRLFFIQSSNTGNILCFKMRLFLPSVMKSLGLNTRVVNLFNFLYFLYNFQRVFIRTIYLSNVFQYLSSSIHLKYHIYYGISFSENCLLSQKYMFRVWHFHWMLFWEYSFFRTQVFLYSFILQKKNYTLCSIISL